MGVSITGTTSTPLTGSGTVTDASLTVNCAIMGPVNNSMAATMNGTGWNVNFGNVEPGTYTLAARASDNSSDSRQIIVS